MTDLFDKTATLQPEMFRCLLNETFALREKDIEMPLTLVNVKTFPALSGDCTDSAQAREAFSILFESVGQPPLPGGIRCLHHPELGELFLSMNAIQPPLGYQSLRQPFVLYESIFN